jgi:hypothetical protein
MRSLLLTLAVIVLVFSSATAHADPVTYDLNGSFFPLTQFGPSGTITGEITVSIDHNGFPTQPFCIDPICKVRVFLTVENLVVNDDGQEFFFSDPQPVQFGLSENSAGNPDPDIFESLNDSFGNRFQLALEIPYTVGGLQQPFVCTLAGSCDVNNLTSSITSSDFSEDVFAATLTPVPDPVPEPSTLSLLGIGALGLLVTRRMAQV